jgi:uncharacterized membrane protein HdeD (DUF308 family)
MQLYSPVPVGFTSIAKMAAGIMMVIGVLAILLPFYFGVFSVLILGGAVLTSGILGVIYNWQLAKLGADSGANLAPWLFVLLGFLLLSTPKLTLSIAGLLIGAGLIFSGTMGWLVEKRVGNPSIWWQLRHAITGIFGLILILSGASGTAWLIGVFFGLNMLIAGANLWIAITIDNEMS